MVLWSFPSNAATAWMISIALWLHECKFKISSIQGLNLRLTEMNAFRNHLERQRPPKYIFFDLVKTKWDWMQNYVKPVISQFCASRQPPAFIGREKKKFNFSSFKFSFILKSFVLSYISKIFQHPKYWHTNPIRIMSIVAGWIQHKMFSFVWLEMFSERNIFSLSILCPIKDSRVCRLEWSDINVSLITLLKVNRNLQEIWEERKVCLK